ncbi:hypothetical protein LTS17_005939 [Exophiala oligosperma]
MGRKVPTGQASIEVPGLGQVQGRLYSNDVRQYYGIPYGRLSKRWTRASMVTSWDGGFHNGTKLGNLTFPIRKHYPSPPEYEDGNDMLVPVPETDQFKGNWLASDTDCLRLNITQPPPPPSGRSTEGGPYPVLVYLHGGGFVVGGPHLPIFDGAHFVSRSVSQGNPIVFVAIGYRIGLGGFLASKEIQDDLARDGFSGAGNFGLTDQQLGLAWVQKYISAFNGDESRITLCGESAGGFSVAHQMNALEPPKFINRAIFMSGTNNIMASWPVERWQFYYDELLRYVGIDPNSPDTLAQLREVPEPVLTAATFPIYHNDFPLYSACQDELFPMRVADTDLATSLPDWLEAVMVGATHDEGSLWRSVLRNFSGDNEILERFKSHMDSTQAHLILAKYLPGVDVDRATLLKGLEEMARDAFFSMPNYMLSRRRSRPLGKDVYVYHTDQVSTLDNPVKGLAYHAIDLYYIFLNGLDTMSEGQARLAFKMADDFIHFTNAIEPYPSFSQEKRCMVYGPEDKWEVKTEEADDAERGYTRMSEIIDGGLYERFWNAMDDIVADRYRVDLVLERRED